MSAFEGLPFASAADLLVPVELPDVPVLLGLEGCRRAPLLLLLAGN
jgi:hypothetical protein